MNIKINKEFKESLDNHLLEKRLFGSKDGEDKDWLCIVKPNVGMDAPMHNRDHFFFYKDGESKEDFVYTTPRCLINGVITGSSTMLFEMIQEGNVPDFFKPFFEEKGIFDLASYKLAKALVGIAQRDWKQAKSLTGDDRLKKIKWSTTYGVWVEEMLDMHNVQYNSLQEYDDVDQYYKHLREVIKDLPVAIGNMDALLLLDLLCGNPENIDSLRFSSIMYYLNWRESL